MDQIGTVEQFSQHLNEQFRTPASAPQIPSLELMSVEAQTLSEKDGRRKEVEAGRMRNPFVLVFKGPGEWMLNQMIHTLEHDEMGTLSLFLAPMGKDENGIYYQAVVN